MLRITACFKAFPAVHRSITYIIITKCTSDYLSFMSNKWIFDEKYKNVTYSVSKVKAELITFCQPTEKFHQKCSKNNCYGTHSLCNVYFHFSLNVHQVEAQVLDPGGDDSSSGDGSDLGAAQNSLEVWTFTWWKGEPLEMNGLDAAQGFESGRNIHISSWKIAWEKTPCRPINHVTGGVKVSLTLENLGQ